MAPSIVIEIGSAAFVVPGHGAGTTGHVRHVWHTGHVSEGHAGQLGHIGQLRLPKKLENAPNVFPVAVPEFPEKQVDIIFVLQYEYYLCYSICSSKNIV